jgi:hypothetical protein
MRVLTPSLRFVSIHVCRLRGAFLEILTIGGSEPKPQKYGWDCQHNFTSLRSRQYVRLAPGRQANGDNHNATRVKKPSGLGAIELCRGHVGLFWEIMDGIHKGA